jgi:uncharacterized protein
MHHGFSFFLTMVFSVFFLLHFYLWLRLVRDRGLEGGRALAATGGMALLSLTIPAGFYFMRAAPRWAVSTLLTLGFTWLGLVFFLGLLLAAGDLMRLFYGAFRLAGKGALPDPQRRKFLRSALATAAGWGGLGLSVTALRGASASAVRVKRVEAGLSRWPKALEGYRIAQVSDLHVGPLIGRDFVQSVVEKVNALKPDLVAVTGDLVDETLPRLRDSVEPVRNFRGRHGVFFVTGNHEYYTGDVDEWLAWLASAGIRPLVNERVSIGGPGGFDLAGMDDLSARGPGHRPDLPKALSGRDPSRPVVLMAHQPLAFEQARLMGVDLQLSGHTHGGQVFPFNLVVGLFQPYLRGLYRRGGSQLYVSCGTGFWGPPMRLGAPSEITEIRISRA